MADMADVDESGWNTSDLLADLPDLTGEDGTFLLSVEQPVMVSNTGDIDQEASFLPSTQRRDRLSDSINIASDDATFLLAVAQPEGFSDPDSSADVFDQQSQRSLTECRQRVSSLTDSEPRMNASVCTPAGAYGNSFALEPVENTSNPSSKRPVIARFAVPTYLRKNIDLDFERDLAFQVQAPSNTDYASSERSRVLAEAKEEEKGEGQEKEGGADQQDEVEAAADIGLHASNTTNADAGAYRESSVGYSPAKEDSTPKRTELTDIQELSEERSVACTPQAASPITVNPPLRAMGIDSPLRSLQTSWPSQSFVSNSPARAVVGALPTEEAVIDPPARAVVDDPPVTVSPIRVQEDVLPAQIASYGSPVRVLPTTAKVGESLDHHAPVSQESPRFDDLPQASIRSDDARNEAETATLPMLDVDDVAESISSSDLHHHQAAAEHLSSPLSDSQEQAPSIEQPMDRAQVEDRPELASHDSDEASSSNHEIPHQEAAETGQAPSPTLDDVQEPSSTCDESLQQALVDETPAPAFAHDAETNPFSVPALERLAPEELPESVLELVAVPFEDLDSQSDVEQDPTPVSDSHAVTIIDGPVASEESLEAAFQAFEEASDSNRSDRSRAKTTEAL